MYVAIQQWVHHKKPELKRQFMEWKHTNVPVRKKFREQRPVKKKKGQADRLLGPEMTYHY